MNPIRRWPTDEQVATLDLGGARSDVMEQILAVPTDSPARSGRRPTRPVSWAVAIPAAVAIVAVVAVPVWLGAHGGPGGSAGPAACGVLDGPPRPYAVLTAPGWTVDHVLGDPADGSIRYVRGEQRLEIFWWPAAQREDYVRDRRRIGRSAPVMLAGAAARMWAYSRTDRTAIRPAFGATFLEVRGEEMGRAAYLRLLAGVRGTDAVGFGDTLPGDVVNPRTVTAAVARMLEGVTVPAGFDADTIHVPMFSDRYQAGAAVTSAVGCAWLSQYRTARAAGDTAAQEQAALAMAGSRAWPVLRWMASRGGWSQVFWEIADGMAAGHALEGAESGIGCTG